MLAIVSAVVFVIFYVFPSADPATLRLVRQGAIDIVTLTSSSTARNLVAALGGDLSGLERSLVAAIGPITAETARELGLNVGVVATEHTIPGLVAALVEGTDSPQRRRGRRDEE